MVFGDDGVGFVESVEDFGPIVASESDGDGGEGGSAVLDLEYEPVIGAAEYGAVGYGEGVLADGGDDPGVEACAWAELESGIIKLCDDADSLLLDTEGRRYAEP